MSSRSTKPKKEHKGSDDEPAKYGKRMKPKRSAPKASDNPFLEDEDFYSKATYAPEKESFRPLKVANRIKEELLLMVPDVILDPRIRKFPSIAITSVDCTGDLKNATVKFTLLSDMDPNATDEQLAQYGKRASDCERLLNETAGFLRRSLSDKMGIKYTPILHFKFDKGLAHALRVENVLKVEKKKHVSEEDTN